MLVVFSPTFVADTKIMFGYNIVAPEAAMRRYSVEKVFLKHLQNSQENICGIVSFLINLQVQCKEHPILKNIYEWFLLNIYIYIYQNLQIHFTPNSQVCVTVFVKFYVRSQIHELANGLAKFLHMKYCDQRFVLVFHYEKF